jgi:type I restriction enzyme S subunit
MSEWNNNKLSYLVDIRVSNVDKKIYPNKKKVKLCNYMDAYSNDYITSNIRYSEGSADLNELNRFRLILNDVIITKDSETPEDIAVSSVVTEKMEDLVCGYDLAILRPRENRIYGPFLMHKLKLPQIQKYFFRMASGSTRYGLTIGGIENTAISHPPLPHQRKIARILTTVDNIIEKTEGAIEKYKAIKQGMMHDLFTRGIDVKTGKLRLSYEDAPELYKETELGMIPKEWEVKKIYEILKSPIRDFGSFSMTNLIKFVESGIPFLKTEVIQDGYIDFEDVSFITSDVHKLLYKSVVNKGDILFTKIGAIGRVAVYKGEIGEYNSNAASAKIQINTSNYNSNFIALKLGSDRVTRDFEKSIISTPPRINLGDINAMHLEIPKKNEQDMIATKLESMINKIRTEEKHLKKIKKLKQGLMQDLLTDKKEVTPDPEDFDNEQLKMNSEP